MVTGELKTARAEPTTEAEAGRSRKAMRNGLEEREVLDEDVVGDGDTCGVAGEPNILCISWDDAATWSDCEA